MPELALAEALPGAGDGLRGRDFLRVDDLDAGELDAVLDLADRLKALQRDRVPHPLLAGRTLAMIFEKPSTRTRVSFEVGMAQLGGHAVHLDAGSSQLGRGEPIADTGAVLGGYVDAIMIRTHAHARVEELAAAASVPVVNGLTDDHHPCQALADLQVLRERLGALEGRRLAWVGDGRNNVCHSLITAAALAGMELVVASPDGYAPDPDVVDAAAAPVELLEDPAAAVAGADAVVTDTWTSMGQEDERARRLHDLAPYQVNAGLLAGAAPGHVVLHCLPAHCGEEITHEVLWGPSSAVWDEAENRLHAQKALLAMVVEYVREGTGV
ncbi:MAG TPA: ornithine carbamoyltransferase [Gaiellales bacterium]|nr:ornithine carbamoyltransferase [Gaiellales bacterium]